MDHPDNVNAVIRSRSFFGELSENAHVVDEEQNVAASQELSEIEEVFVDNEELQHS